MHQNKKQGIFFTAMMCVCMVIGMSSYNMIIRDSFTIKAFATIFLPCFIIAFILEAFIVGNLVQFVLAKLPLNHESRFQMILGTSCLTLLCMVTCMSVFGMLVEGGIPTDIMHTYFATWRTNVVFAFPWQLIIVGPFCRMILGRVQNRQVAAQVD